ncbi:PD-(D/E)XK nuclease family protein, partial [Serratia marcescens]|uniref:PD-(D/E)XK nuclease family protein n=1 Tax=Serratia marcescens TaxID=615 RepID=UPI000A5DAA60
RGTAVHDILETWWKADRCDVDPLRPRALAMLRDQNPHPMMRALWQPRLIEAIAWIAKEVAIKAAEGRHVLGAEGKGEAKLAGVTLTGRFDRIDKAADGSLVVIDYKTGKPPSTTAVREGFSLQLGLLGLIAERGGFEGVSGKAGGFEYWSLG